jgi:hypothetical protein
MTADTNDETEARLDTLFASLSGSDRVIMIAQMFDDARALMIARIRELEPDISAAELKVRLLERLYGDDLDADTLARVAASIRSAAQPPDD